MRGARIFLFLILASGIGAGAVLADFDIESLPEPYRQRLTGVLDQAGGNRNQLLQALAVANSQGHLEAACFLISQMKWNDLDALKIDSFTLNEHIEYAYKASGLLPYSLPEGLFFDYVLDFRIFNEPATAWRKELFGRFYPLAEGANSAEEAALIVNRWIAKNLDVISSQTVASPVLHILNAAKGDREQVCTLTAAILRSIAIPSRVVRADCRREQAKRDFWVEVCVQDRWTPLYPESPEKFGNFCIPNQKQRLDVAQAFARAYLSKVDRTSEYTKGGTVQVSVSGNEQPVFVAVHIFGSGSWFIVQKGRTDSQNLFQLRIGAGEYLLAAEDESSRVLLQRIIVRPDKEIQCRFDFAASKCKITED